MPRSADQPRLTLVARRPRVALFAEPRDLHAASLARSFRRLGAEVRRVRFADCAFDTTRASGLSLPGFGRRPPDAALVRSIPAGSFEAVTRRLGILHALREQGVLVWNDARAIERCVDKSTTSFFLARAGLATPPTWTVETIAAATAIVRREGRQGPLVLKPLFGSQGRGLRLIRGAADLPDADDMAGVYYLQRFIGEETGAFHDYRVMVVGGEAIAAMSRHSTGWITNVRQGGEPRPAALDAELASLAERAAAAVGASFCGVDIVRRGGRPAMVIEVNSMPAWAGLQKVTNLDVSLRIATGLMAALRAGEDRRAAS